MSVDRRDESALEEWLASHPRYPDFLRFVKDVVPEQLTFVIGEYYPPHASHLCVALDGETVVGAIRFAVLPIGPEARCPIVQFDGMALTEAKIHAFAVAPEFRGRGIGTRLQRWAIHRARDLGCHQVASYSCYDKQANYHVKLSLGFAAQPESHGDNEQGVYFLMPLRARFYD